MKQLVYPVLGVFLLALSACSREDGFITDLNETATRSLATDYVEPLFNYSEQLEIHPENFRLIFQDDEPNEVIWNPSLRSFQTNELLQVRRVSDNVCRITSYIPKPLKNVVIKSQINEEDGYFELLKIDSIPAFGQFEFTPNFVNKRTTYKTELGGYVSIQVSTIPDFISFQVESSDPLWNMLSRIKVAWNFNFNEHGWGSSWRDMNVLYAREWVVMITNYAYIVSTPEWEYLIDHWKEVTGADLYANVSKKVVIDYQAFFRAARAKRSATLGLTAIGGGLGGGSVVGVDHWNFYSHYRSQGYLAIAHECGHWFGYGHESSICNNYGHSDYSSVIMYLHDYMWKRNMIPYTDRDMLGFVNYKGTPLFQHPTVDNGLYNYNVGPNYIANWFIAHPVR